MVNKSISLNWLKTRMERISNGEETDNVQIECCLVRALSDYREKELSSIHIDTDFNQRLMYRLEHIESEDVETYCFKKPRNLNRPFLFSAGLAFVAIISFTMIDFNESPNLQSPAEVSPINIKTISSFNSKENALIQDLKKNPENVRVLEKLEMYYSESGKKEHATEVHSVLETVSKKY